MKLFTKEIQTRLIWNHQNKQPDPQPVVKLFCPWGAATWLLTEYDPEQHMAFGLCDLGMGFPELGYVSVHDLEQLRGPGGLKIERDMHWKPTKTLSEYADEASLNQRIIA